MDRSEVPELLAVEGWKDRFGILAGMTTRASGDYALTSTQAVGPALERWRSLQANFRFPAMVTSLQRHGTALAVHDPGTGWTLLEGLDGHVTRSPGVLLTVTVADCIPVYLVDSGGKTAALLHAGWRGVASGILQAGVQQLGELSGSRPSDLVAHLGVGICGECYEVDSEVFTACGEPRPRSGVGPLDLRSVLSRQADEIGLGEVSVSRWCSAHYRDQFFSHRASGGKDGRMVAYLGFPA